MAALRAGGRVSLSAMIGVRAVLVLGILQSVRGQVTVDGKAYAWLESDVVLKCNLKISEGNVVQITWKRIENGQNVDFLTHSNSGVRKLTPFAETRVDFLGDATTDGSIKIRDVTLTDERVYTCIFTIFPTGTLENMTTLTVQAKPDIHVDPWPDSVVAKLPYQTVAICVAGGAKPAANINWWTGGLDYNSSESEIQNSNRTVTTRSQLIMIPGAGIKGRTVTCIISQNNETQAEKSLTIQNVQYPPDSVRVEVRSLDNGAVQFICVEDSSPPATKFTWKRKDAFNSSAAVELGNEKILSVEDFPSALYICEVTNTIGKSSGFLYVYKAPGSSVCLHACLWPWLILIVALGVCIYCWYRRQPKNKDRGNRMETL